jgi:drug/metabolite transporter (DMT)-like permease
MEVGRKDYWFAVDIQSPAPECPPVDDLEAGHDEKARRAARRCPRRCVARHRGPARHGAPVVFEIELTSTLFPNPPWPRRVFYFRHPSRAGRAPHHMNDSSERERQRQRLMVVAAFAAIYLVWGSTYLAIRVAVQTLPAFLSAGVRFVVAGALLFAWLLARGHSFPSRAQWRHAFITGTLMLVGGNGLVVWAERTLSSGFTALLVALAPVWFALLDWLRPGGTRPRPKTIAGIVIGFIGVLVLVEAREHGGDLRGEWWSAFAVIIAGITWAGGSLHAKYAPAAASPWMNAAAQMLCGGAGLLFTGVITGEPFRTDWTGISGRSLAALAYLIVFGSWIGFSAYIWLLKASTPARISTYAYVNPVIAVLLGWAFLDEPVTAGILYGAIIILAGVAVISVPPGATTSAMSRAVAKIRQLGGGRRAVAKTPMSGTACPRPEPARDKS